MFPDFVTRITTPEKEKGYGINFNNRGMMMEFVERRKHVRVYFDEQVVPVGEVEFGDRFDYDVLPCMIWGLSAGGVRLSIDEKREVLTRDVLTLSRISAPQLCPDTPEGIRIMIQVGWSMYNEETRKTYMGCRFLQLPDDVRVFFAELLRNGREEKIKTL